MAILTYGTGLEYRPSQWVYFRDRNGPRWCQMDALLVDRSSSRCIIYEVKYQHTPDAWWQLRELYLPVLRVALPSVSSIGLCEVVHWHDPAVRFPERYDFTNTPLKVPHVNTVAVHIFNPRRAALRQDVMVASGHNGGEGDGEVARQERSEEGAL